MQPTAFSKPQGMTLDLSTLDQIASDVQHEACIVWNDQTGECWRSTEGFDTVIHLAGAGIGDKRWNAKRKASSSPAERCRPSNLLICLAVLNNRRRPSVRSAVGIYGNRGEEKPTENSALANFATTCLNWEAAGAAAKEAGIRTAWIRTGIVRRRWAVRCKNSCCQQNLAPVAQQVVVANTILDLLDDQIYATYHLMMNESCEGAYNLQRPNRSRKAVRQGIGAFCAAQPSHLLQVSC